MTDFAVTTIAGGGGGGAGPERGMSPAALRDEFVVDEDEDGLLSEERARLRGSGATSPVQMR